MTSPLRPASRLSCRFDYTRFWCPQIVKLKQNRRVIRGLTSRRRLCPVEAHLGYPVRQLCDGPRDRHASNCTLSSDPYNQSEEERALRNPALMKL